MADPIRIDDKLTAAFKPERPEDGHKNTFGTVLVCAGSRFMTGAAVLACASALRSGAGLVKVFSEEKVLDAVSSIEPCALLELRPDEEAELLRKAIRLSKKTDSVLIGSGIPADYRHMEALISVFLENVKGVVLDAGALTDKKDILSRLTVRLKNRTVPAVITPHIGEFARLTGLTNSEVADNAGELAVKFATDNNCVVVLKSYRTYVAVPDGKLYFCEDANSGLAKGGSGDVLAGLLAGFLAQGMEPFKAACSAVFIHSKAGRAAADDIGTRYMLPTDLMTYLPEGYAEAGWSDNDE